MSSDLEDKLSNSRANTGLLLSAGGLMDTVTDIGDVTEGSEVRQPQEMAGSRRPTQSLRLSSSWNNLSYIGALRYVASCWATLS